MIEEGLYLQCTSYATVFNFEKAVGGAGGRGYGCGAWLRMRGVANESAER